MKVAVLNGPNLNLLGSREPDIYGTTTLAEIERDLRAQATEAGAVIHWVQTNHEGEFVEAVQGLVPGFEGALVNGAAFTHTSMAIRDALLAVKIPFVEVHLSNIFSREPERRHSLFADLAVGIVAGFGPASYGYGLQALLQIVRARDA